MKASSDLFDLIKSLNKSEKRYIQLNAVHAGDKDYMKLFAAIDKQNEYDEGIIKKKLSKERFIKRLPAVKNYLYEFIMKSLAAYYADLSADSRIRHFLNYSEILFDKKLFGQSLKVLSKAKKIALKYNKNLFYYDILQAEQLLFQSSGMLKEIELHSNEFYIESKKILGEEDNFVEYKKLFYQVYIRYQKGGLLRDKDDLKQLNLLMGDPLLKSEEKALTVEGKRTFNLIYVYYSYLIGNTEAAYKYTKRLTEFVYPSDDLKGEIKYISSIRNLLSTQYTLKKFEDMETALKKLHQIIPRSEHSTIILDYCLGLEISLYIDTGRIQKAIAVLPKAELAIKNNDRNLKRSEYLLLQFNIAIVYFTAEEYSKCLHWINNILNEKSYQRKDIIACVKIMNLLVHYELGNTELLEYLLRAYAKEIKDNSFFIERTFVEFAKNSLCKIASQKDMLSALSGLKEKIIGMISSESEKKLLDAFDLTVWIDSKISNKKMEVILQQRYQK